VILESLVDQAWRRGYTSLYFEIAVESHFFTQLTLEVFFPPALQRDQDCSLKKTERKKNLGLLLIWGMSALP